MSPPAARRPTPGCAPPRPMPASSPARARRTPRSPFSKRPTSSRPDGCRWSTCATRSRRASRSPASSSTPSEGASEILLVLASALNRGGGESFVRLYLQYALALKPDSDVVLVQLAAVAEQQKDAEGAIALYRRIPGYLAAEARLRSCSSASTSPTSTAATRRSASCRRWSTRIPTTCAAIWRSAASTPRRRTMPAPPRSTTRRSSGSSEEVLDAEDPSGGQLEHLLPARHRL